MKHKRLTKALFFIIFFPLFMVIKMIVPINLKQIINCPVSWGCRIYQLLLCREIRPPPNECPGYDTMQSDGEVSVMLELWGMWRTLSLPLLPDPLQPGVVAPDKGPIYGLNRMCLELFELELIICIKIDVALNNLKRLICHKTQPNKPTN